MIDKILQLIFSSLVAVPFFLFVHYGNITRTESPSETITAAFTQDTTTNFANPYRGVQVAAGGATTAKTKQDVSLNGIVTAETNYRRHWGDLMSAVNTVNSSNLIQATDFFAKVRANESSLNFRFIEFEDSYIACPSFETSTNGAYEVNYISPTVGGTVNGNQSGAGTATGLTVTAGHSFASGQRVSFTDRTTSTTVVRTLTAKGATTISWASTVEISVNSTDSISILSPIARNQICNFENSNTRTDLNNLFTQFASYTQSGALQGGLRAWNVFGAYDQPAWGDFGEANYSSWTVTPFYGGVVDGAQSGAGTQTSITVITGHDFAIGQEVQVADLVSSTNITRVLTGTTATTISWASTTAISVADLAIVYRTGRVKGTVSNLGTEMPPALNGTPPSWSTAAQDDMLDKFVATFGNSDSTYCTAATTNNMFVNTFGDTSSQGQQYGMITKLGGWRQDCWGFKNTPAACPGAGFQHCTLMPAQLHYTLPLSADPGLLYSHNNGPAILETCSGIDTGWGSYDRPASINFLQQVGASTINIKNKFSTFAGWTQASAVERGLGYRISPVDISHTTGATAGTQFIVDTQWTNSGWGKFVAPNYYLAVKLQKHSGTESYTYVSNTRPTWLPGVINNVEHVITIPTYLSAGLYDVYLGVVYKNTTARPNDQYRPAIQLAVTPQPADGSFWYTVTNVTIVNASPTTTPTTDYAAQFTAASNNFLLLSDGGMTALDPVGTDFSVAALVYLDAVGADRPIFTKGAPGLTNQSFNLEYENATTQFRFSISNGATVYAVNDTTLGTPSLATWYCLIGIYDDTGKTISLNTNRNVGASTGTTGSISDTAANIRIGRDPVGANMSGRIDKIRYSKRKWTTAEQNQICTTLGKGMLYKDATFALLDKNYLWLELDEASGLPRDDSFQHWRFTDNGTVGRAASNG